LTGTGLPVTDFRNGIVKPRIQIDAALNALDGAGDVALYRPGTVVTLTATSLPGFTFVKWQRNGADFSTTSSVSVTMNASHTMTAVFTSGGGSSPVINSVVLTSPKLMRIDGANFGVSPRVLINGVDRSGFIISSSSSSIQLKGKRKKLGLVTGVNTVQVIGPNGVRSNIVVVNL
jgi:hypothetical protein